jgi:hypothetical protein
MKHFFTFLFILLIAKSDGQSIISEWNYEPLSGAFATPAANIGSGTSALVGSMTTASPGTATGINTLSGCGTQVSGQTAWNISNANPGSSNESSGAQWNVSTVGNTAISVSWEQRWTSTSPNAVRFQYTTDGTSWNNFTMTSANTTVCDGNINNGIFETNRSADRFRRITVNLDSISTVENNANFGFRVVAAYFNNSGQFRQVVSSGTVSTGGGWRFDNVKVIGTSACSTPTNAVSATANALATSINLNWANAASPCFDQYLVVAKLASAVSASPTGDGTLYTANAAFGTTGTDANLPSSEFAVYKSNGTSVSVTGLSIGQTYHFTIFARKGTTWSSGVSLSATTRRITFYSQASGTAGSGTIWDTIPSGVAKTATSLGGFSADVNVVVQNGHDVVVASQLPCNNFTINNGGKAYRNNSTTLAYLRVFGDSFTINGTLGNAPTLDALGLEVEGTNLVISGAGTATLSRIRKATSTNSTSSATLLMNLDFVVAGHAGTSFLNNTNATSLNFTVGSGVILDCKGNADIAIDGTFGQDVGDRGGSFVVNGTLKDARTLYLQGLNNTLANSFTINSGGIVNAKYARDSVGLDVIINSGGTLEVDSELVLIAGNLNIPTGANLIFKSRSESHCAFINDYSSSPNGTPYSGTLTGTVTSERFVPDPGLNQHFIGSPLSGVTFSDIGTTSGANNVFVTPTSSCSEDSLAPGSNYGNFFEWSEANVGGGCILNGWRVKSSGTLESAKGYSAYLNGNGIYDVSGTANLAPSYNTSITRDTWSTTTTLEGNSYESGWNLVSNPYLSSITPAVKADFDNDIKVYNATGPYKGTYITKFAGNPATIIPPHQAIYVRKSTVGTGTYTFNKTECVRTQETFNKNGENVFKVIVEGNGFADKTQIGIDQNASAGFDNGSDAVKFLSKSGQPSIYTIADNRKAEYNVFNSVLQTPSLPLLFHAGTDGQFVIRFEELEVLPTQISMTLEDKLLNTITPISSNTSYSFSAKAKDTKERFVLHFTEKVIVDPTSINDQDVDDIHVWTIGNMLFVNLKDEQSTSTRIDIYNPIGQRISTKENISNQIEGFDLLNHSNGMYIVSISFKDKKTITKKFVLNK